MGVPPSASLTIDSLRWRLSSLVSNPYPFYHPAVCRGVLSSINGAIYGFPAHADAVLKIQPETGEVTTIGDCHLEGFQYKWCEGSLGNTGGHPSELYCIAQSASTVKLIVVPRPTLISLRLGGAIDPVSQCVYCIPSNANCVLNIDPRTDTVTMFGSLSNLKNKWQVRSGRCPSLEVERAGGTPPSCQGILEVRYFFLT
jgi:hypothetical protein